VLMLIRGLRACQKWGLVMTGRTSELS